MSNHDPYSDQQLSLPICSSGLNLLLCNLSTLRKKYYPFSAFPVSAPIMFRLTSVLDKAHPL